MVLPRKVRVTLWCALLLLPSLQAATAAAISRLDLRAGYDTDPGDASDPDGGDAWASLTAGKTIVDDTGGPLSISLDIALGATAYARLTDLDRVSLVVSPAFDYVVSQRVAATVALAAEGQLVSDDNRSAWGWGGALRLRELLSPSVSLVEYVAYRDLNARDPEYSGTNVALGVYARLFLGERWLLGTGVEYAHGNFLLGDRQGAGSSELGSGRRKSQKLGETVVGDAGQSLVSADEDRWSGSLALEYTWSAKVSSGAEYIYTRVISGDGGDNQHAVIVSTTLGF